MVTAARRPCRAAGCGALVARGYCERHGQAGRARDRRGTATARGYGAAWAGFRGRYLAALGGLGVAAVCGATWPGGPVMTASRCRAEGRLTGGRLHLHHVPALTPAERKVVAIVCDPLRVGVLCAVCHNAETARTRGR